MTSTFRLSRAVPWGRKWALAIGQLGMPGSRGSGSSCPAGAPRASEWRFLSLRMHLHCLEARSETQIAGAQSFSFFGLSGA